MTKGVDFSAELPAFSAQRPRSQAGACEGISVARLGLTGRPFWARWAVAVPRADVERPCFPGWIAPPLPDRPPWCRTDGDAQRGLAGRKTPHTSSGLSPEKPGTGGPEC